MNKTLRILIFLAVLGVILLVLLYTGNLNGVMDFIIDLEGNV